MSRLLFCLPFVVAISACESVPYAPAEAGAACDGLEAVCATDGSAVLTCDGDAFVEDDACADGCTTAGSWFSATASEVCCDNGAERTCVNIYDSADRETFSFSG